MATITAKQYAEKIGYSPSAVTKKLKVQLQPYTLPYTTRVEKFGNTWLIDLVHPFPAKKAAAAFKEMEIDAVKDTV